MVRVFSGNGGLALGARHTADWGRPQQASSDRGLGAVSLGPHPFLHFSTVGVLHEGVGCGGGRCGGVGSEGVISVSSLLLGGVQYLPSCGLPPDPSRP